MQCRSKIIFVWGHGRRRSSSPLGTGGSKSGYVQLIRALPGAGTWVPAPSAQWINRHYALLEYHETSVNVWAGIVDDYPVDPKLLPELFIGVQYPLPGEWASSLLKPIFIIQTDMWYMHEKVSAYFSTPVRHFLSTTYPERLIVSPSNHAVVNRLLCGNNHHTCKDTCNFKLLRGPVLDIPGNL
ncbi:hypothetical protein TNCV_994431 [Trichonephila clavipes]|nr:hypothetical protein TNCV_994431 [Trichonephila clavipes]